MAARSLAAACIRVRFELQPAFENALDVRKEMFRRIDPPGVYEKELRLPVPARDPKMLLKLLRLRLQSNSPGAPIRKIVLGAESARPRATQGGLFLPSFPDPEKLELTIARIANVVGEGNIGSPALVDTWRPGEFQMQRFLAPLEAAAAGHTHCVVHPATPHKSFKASTSFRIFRPPVPATLELHAGRPTRVVFQGLYGQVLAASGPWRTSGDWWREDSWQQDEWDLEIHFHFSSGNRDRSGGSASRLRAVSFLLRRAARQLVRAGNVRLMYVELHARSAFSFLEGASLPEELARMCKERDMPAMALLDRDGVYGSPRFHLAANKHLIRAHIGAEVTSAAGWRYPLLVESRQGYQNLCRLITRMKLRARKGEGIVQPEEIAAMGGGLICLTGGEEGPLAHALSNGGMDTAIECVQQLCRSFGRGKCLRRIAAPSLPRGGSAQSGRSDHRAKAEAAAACDQWRLATRCPSNASCSMSSPAFVIIARSQPPVVC